MKLDGESPKPIITKYLLPEILNANKRLAFALILV